MILWIRNKTYDIFHVFFFLFLFNWIYLGNIGSKKPHIFQVCNSPKCHLHTAFAPIHHPKWSSFPSTPTPPLPTTYPQPPFPLATTTLFIVSMCFIYVCMYVCVYIYIYITLYVYIKLYMYTTLPLPGLLKKVRFFLRFIFIYLFIYLLGLTAQVSHWVNVPLHFYPLIY